MRESCVESHVDAWNHVRETRVESDVDAWNLVRESRVGSHVDAWNLVRESRKNHVPGRRMSARKHNENLHSKTHLPRDPRENDSAKAGKHARKHDEFKEV